MISTSNLNFNFNDLQINEYSNSRFDASYIGFVKPCSLGRRLGSRLLQMPATVRHKVCNRIEAQMQVSCFRALGKKKQCLEIGIMRLIPGYVRIKDSHNITNTTVTRL